jgi:hypothetical protein
MEWGLRLIRPSSLFPDAGQHQFLTNIKNNLFLVTVRLTESQARTFPLDPGKYAGYG